MSLYFPGLPGSTGLISKETVIWIKVCVRGEDGGGSELEGARTSDIWKLERATSGGTMN